MGIAAESPAGDHTVYGRRWWTLAVLCLSLLVVLGGNSNVNVAVPVLSRDLDATTSELQWIVAAYSVAFAGLLFPAAAIGDRFGRKGAVQLGLFTFLIGATLATASTAAWELIACRALMGAAAAFIMPSTLSIVVNVFPQHERAVAIALWAAFTGIAGTIAPVASGWLLGHFWFGSAFLVNVPVIVVALVSGAYLIPTSRDPARARLDPGGAALSVVGISLLVYGIIEAPDSGWGSSQTLVTLGFASVVLALFVLYELRVQEPMLEMRYFRDPGFSTGTGGTMLVFCALFGVMFLLTQYFQLVLDYSPLSAAVRFLPVTPILIGVSLVTPRLAAHVGTDRTVAGGMALVAVGLGMFCGLGLRTSYLYVLAALLPLVAGIGLVMAPMTAAIMSAVPARRAGAGSAMNDASRELGAALGVAVLGSIAASRFGQRMDALLTMLPSDGRTSARGSLGGALEAATSMQPAAERALTLGAQRAFVAGFQVAVIVGAIVTAIAAVVVYRYLPRRPPTGADLTRTMAGEGLPDNPSGAS